MIEKIKSFFIKKCFKNEIEKFFNNQINKLFNNELRNKFLYYKQLMFINKKIN